MIVDSKVEIIAHRGESADAPENTLAAFALAWQRDVRAIELDVHLTKDDRLVVCHDADTKRTAGISRLIRESTWEQLKDLDVGRWKDNRFSGEKLPLLQSALATIPADCRCFIEVKVGPEAIPALLRVIAASKKSPEQLPIISFNPDTIAEAAKKLPQHKTYLVASFKQDESTGVWTPSVEDLVAKAIQIGADGLDLSYKGPLTAESVQKIRDAKLEFYVWTVDDVDSARRMIELGVDGITTNKAGWLRSSLDK
jgi:glycerophosphoryl diester phosphodiesterase